MAAGAVTHAVGSKCGGIAMPNFRSLSAGAALCGLLSVMDMPAYAQGLGEADSATATAIRKTCDKDYQAHCQGKYPALALEVACLSQYYVNLSPGCRAALQSLKSAGGQSAPAEGEQ